MFTVRLEDTDNARKKVQSLSASTESDGELCGIFRDPWAGAVDGDIGPFMVLVFLH